MANKEIRLTSLLLSSGASSRKTDIIYRLLRHEPNGSVLLGMFNISFFIDLKNDQNIILSNNAVCYSYRVIATAELRK